MSLHGIHDIGDVAGTQRGKQIMLLESGDENAFGVTGFGVVRFGFVRAVRFEGGTVNTLSLLVCTAVGTTCSGCFRTTLFLKKGKVWSWK